MKLKIRQETYLASCNTILNAEATDAEKFNQLMEYASKFEIATETDTLNELLHSKKS